MCWCTVFKYPLLKMLPRSAYQCETLARLWRFPSCVSIMPVAFQKVRFIEDSKLPVVSVPYCHRVFERSASSVCNLLLRRTKLDLNFTDVFSNSSNCWCCIFAFPQGTSQSASRWIKSPPAGLGNMAATAAAWINVFFRLFCFTWQEVNKLFPAPLRRQVERKSITLKAKLCLSAGWFTLVANVNFLLPAQRYYI